MKLFIAFLFLLACPLVADPQAMPNFWVCFPNCGLDASSGSQASPMQTVRAAYEACLNLTPIGGGRNNACHIHVLSPPWFPGSGPHVMAMWSKTPSSFKIIGPGDKNWSSPPAGWLKQIAVDFTCEDGAAANWPSGPECQWMNGPAGVTRSPVLQISGTNTPIRFHGFSFNGCVPLEESVDSSGNAVQSTTSYEAQTVNVKFDNSSFETTQARGCGPGILLGEFGFNDEFSDSVIAGNASESYAVSTAALDGKGNMTFTIGVHDIPAINEFRVASAVFVSGVANPEFNVVCRVSAVTATTVTCPRTGAAVTSKGGHLFSERSRSVLQYSVHGFTLENVLLTGGGIGSLTGPGCMGFTVIAHDGPLSEGLPTDDAQIWRDGLNQPVWTYCGGLSIIGNPYPADPLGPNVETNRWVK